VAERQTRQKDAIERMIRSSQAPLLPEEIAERARQEVPRLGMATVYRSLKRLQEEGLVCVVELPGQSPRYESTSKGHHHHFLCEDCGKVLDLMGCAGDVQQMAPPGYEVKRHEITLIGICPECHS